MAGVEKLRAQCKRAAEDRDASRVEVLQLKALLEQAQEREGQREIEGVERGREAGRRAEQLKQEKKERESEVMSGMTALAAAELRAALERAQAEAAVLVCERDSLVGMVAQKDGLMQVQAQQQQQAVQMLKRAQTGGEGGALGAEVDRLSSRLSELFTNTSSSPTSYSVAEDTQRLVGVMRDMRLALEQAQGLRAELQAEGVEKAALKRALGELQRSSRVAGAGRAVTEQQTAAMSAELLRTRQQVDVALAERGSALQKADSSAAAYEERLGALQQEVLRAKEGAALATAQLHHLRVVSKSQEAEAHQAREQAQQARERAARWEAEAQASAGELSRSGEAMQSEYAALCASVRELGSLDALKDESIRELAADRDRAALQRDQALAEMAGERREGRLRGQDLRELDRQLLRAVEAGRYKLSPEGKRKSLLLLDVSDATMYALARRQQQQQQEEQEEEEEQRDSARRQSPSPSWDQEQEEEQKDEEDEDDEAALEREISQLSGFLEDPRCKRARMQGGQGEGAQEQGQGGLRRSGGKPGASVSNGSLGASGGKGSSVGSLSSKGSVISKGFRGSGFDDEHSRRSRSQGTPTPNARLTFGY
ncbi:hypothetical protein B484DRAFT_119420 [Ochromonadaceae sp. CCMP2298]|nr:hypothetical protein B484DRAFT_119420 [Ochromonadaceae sp. CCMP2298]